MMLNRGQLLGSRYELQEVLGRGGMGIVFRALDRISQRQVALKQVSVAPANLRFSSFDPSQEARLALAQEFKILASLRHPNIISVLDYGFENEQPYFVMDFLDDSTMLFEAAQGHSMEEKTRLLLQVLQALVYCHQRDVIHRDLKPDNILVRGDQVKVMDFGLSIKMEDAEQYGVAGTIEYIAPEIFMGAMPSVASDLYAVGVIAYELYMEDYLYNESDQHVVIQQVLSSYQPDLSALEPKALAAVIMRLLSRNPQDRYANAREVISALATATEQPLPPETIAIRESFLQAASLVGREAELASMTAMLDAATRNQGELLLVHGESGVGKSRLLEELRTLALVRGFTVVRGDTSSVGAAPYQPWRPVLRWLALLATLTDEEASTLKPLVPDIGDLIFDPREISDPPEMNPLFAQQRLLLVVEKLFYEQNRPMMIILEDLQWAGSESIALLQALYPILARRPVLVVGTYRDDEVDLSAQFVGAMSLKLNRLPRQHIAQLSAAMLGQDKLHGELLELLQRETEGNVFFLVEVLRVLAQESGKLESIGQRPIPSQVFAGGVEQIILRRLQRLPPELIPMLQSAAAVGRTLDPKLLQQIYGTGFDLDKWLLHCESAAILEAQESNWRFTHDKLRDTVLRQAEPEQRQTMHRQVATAIETVYLYAPEHISALAYHWAQAQDSIKEENYAALAGKQALANGAYREAVRYFIRAVELNHESPSLSDKKLVLLMQQLGEAYVALDDPVKAQECFAHSLQLSKETDYRWGIATALNALGSLSLQYQQPHAANTYFRRAISVGMEVRAQQTVLVALMGLARLWATNEQTQDAVRAASLVLHHVVTDRQTALLAQQLLDDLRERVPPALYDSAVQVGSSSSLRQMVEEIAPEN